MSDKGILDANVLGLVFKGWVSTSNDIVESLITSLDT